MTTNTPPPVDFITPRISKATAFWSAKYIIENFIAPLNEVIDGFVTDVYNDLSAIEGYKVKKGKKKPIYRYSFYCHNIARWFNNARRELSHIVELQRALIAEADAKERFCDYSDNFYEEMKADVRILYYTILQELTRGEADNRVVLANIETVKILLLLAVQAYDELFADLNIRSGYDFHRTYAYLELSSVKYNWHQAETEVANLTDHKKPIDLNSSEQIKRAWKIIQKKLVHGEYINKAVKRTFPDAVPSPESAPTAEIN